uniref:Uncharacterized protein n=1 Tax=Arundo donax TaxID=35708 RepID=A0A0A8ZWK1_ARUDO
MQFFFYHMNLHNELSIPCAYPTRREAKDVICKEHKLQIKLLEYGQAGSNFQAVFNRMHSVSSSSLWANLFLCVVVSLSAEYRSRTISFLQGCILLPMEETPAVSRLAAVQVFLEDDVPCSSGFLSGGHQGGISSCSCFLFASFNSI